MLDIDMSWENIKSLKTFDTIKTLKYLGVSKETIRDIMILLLDSDDIDIGSIINDVYTRHDEDTKQDDIL